MVSAITSTRFPLGECADFGEHREGLQVQRMRVAKAVSVSVALVLSACSGRKDLPCDTDGFCDLSPGGLCVPAPTGHKWCAYPDGDCPSGFRYSNDDVGDGVGGTCTAAFALTVSVGGSASGSVTSDPPGLECSAGTCSHPFPAGAQVFLSAGSGAGAFLGWSDACSGFGGCTITMDADKSVGALFGIPGQALWVQHAGAGGDDQAKAIAHDSVGNLVVVGQFRNSIQLGTSTLTSVGGFDIFVAKLDANTGAVVWAKRFGGSGDDDALSLALNDADEIFITGSVSSSVDFGGGLLMNAGNLDGYILGLDAAGNYGWAYLIGGSGFDSARAVAARGASVAVVASFQNSMTSADPSPSLPSRPTCSW